MYGTSQCLLCTEGLKVLPWRVRWPLQVLLLLQCSLAKSPQLHYEKHYLGRAGSNQTMGSLILVLTRLTRRHSFGKASTSATSSFRV